MDWMHVLLDLYQGPISGNGRDCFVLPRGRVTCSFFTKHKVFATSQGYGDLVCRVRFCTPKAQFFWAWKR